MIFFLVIQITRAIQLERTVFKLNDMTTRGGAGGTCVRALVFEFTSQSSLYSSVDFVRVIFLRYESAMRVRFFCDVIET